MTLSYNTNWWHYQQEAIGADNWDMASIKKSWYNCVTKNTIKEDDAAALYYQEFGTSQEMLQEIINYYGHIGYEVFIKTRSRNGYLAMDCFAVLPYSGQWGKGWIIASQRNKTTVDLTYILIGTRGGSPDGIANYIE